ncbi:hypothetical protein CWC22_022035 [Pseudoalteromonas rubra]|uniref:Uncharacterized protein n=1 Tax=Pseudoalteromonas rubra TaxID=43658 RepID=A0A5S3UVN2_9GAMM|nr:hypothetical protein [Pseudoalteromonas rubra]QPB85690.1 hypothetical protein CWC22_022035 [Pseudoalteromonas rubra]
MRVDDLIKSLMEVESCSVLRARFGREGEDRLLDIFGNHNGFPVISTFDYEPGEQDKALQTLLTELVVWRNSKADLLIDNEVHLSKVTEHEDGSYDIQYYPVILVKEHDGYLIVQASCDESPSLREHFEA